MVSVLLPIAHFVLVPGFLLAGPIYGWLRFRQRSLVLRGSGTCPGCGVELTIKPQPERWPMAMHCGGCKQPLELRQGELEGPEAARSSA